MSARTLLRPRGPAAVTRPTLPPSASSIVRNTQLCGFGLVFGLLLGLATPGAALTGQDLSPPVGKVVPKDTTVATTTSSIPITVEWCENVALASFTRTLTVNGVSRSTIWSNGQKPGCVKFGTQTATIPLAYGSNSIVATVEDSDGNVGQANRTIVRPAPSYTVAVTPDAQPVSAARATALTQRFTVAASGNSAATYTMSVLCTGAVSGCGAPSPASLALSPGDSGTVDVGYTSGGAGSTGRVRLAATYSTWSDSGWIDVAVPITVATTPDAGAATPVASSAASHLFTVRNTAATSATFNLTAACSGSATGCAAPSSVVVGANDSANVTVTYSAGGAGVTGRLTLTARHGIDLANVDSGYVSVTPGTPMKSVVNVDGVNAHTTIERDLCLGIATTGGGYECGDLRLVHALPATRTLNRARVPTLLYNSAHATPLPIMRADVTLPAGAGTPDSVTATLRSPAGVVVGRGRWSGASWIAGATRRVAVADTVGGATTTGVTAYRLQVTNWYASGVQNADSVTREVAVVRRQGSPFGAGWWLAGLERMYAVDSRLLWVGGDGSTRLYSPDALNANVFRAPNLDRPDSITRVTESGATIYRRHLRGGTVVKFDASLRHVATINRLGHETSFIYTDATDTLRKIVLPANGLVREYVFTYAPTSVTIDAPQAGALRRTVVTLDATHRRVTQILDPDATTVTFGYPASGDVRTVVRRTNRRGHATLYRYDGAGKLAGDSVEATPMVRTFRAAESVGMVAVIGSAAPPSDSAFTLIDGPRSDVVDQTRLWVDRFGAPIKVRDALGSETTVARDAQWPALATSVRSPNGRVVTATYAAGTGLLLSSVDSATYKDSSGVRTYAMTTYAWDPKWEFVTRVTPPLDSSTTFAYSATDGQRLWQQMGGDTTKFFYTSLGPLRATLTSDGGRDSLAYDAAGNLSMARTPLGFAIYYRKDALGRDTLVLSPIATADTAALRLSTPPDSVGLRQRFVYDAAGLDTLNVTWGGGDTLRVRKRYDAEGNLDTLSQLGAPDINGIGWVARGFTYDRLGRQIDEAINGGKYLFWTYDAAGNLLSGGRSRAARSYDALGRVVRIGGDDTLTYDAMGNVLTANNEYARISRSYNLNGTLATDTLKIATADSTALDFTEHIFPLSYGYDLSGRRSSLKLPNPDGTLTYGYDARTGQLARITEPSGIKYGYYYGPGGRLDSLIRRDGLADRIREVRRHDLDGRLRRRIQQSGADVLHDDSLRYDARGKIVQALGSQDRASYDGLGTLLAGYYSGVDEEFEMDPLGNRRFHARFGNSPSETNYYYQPGTGRLTKTIGSAGMSGYPDTTHHQHDGYGNSAFSYNVKPYDVSSPLGQIMTVHRNSASQYNGENRLVVSALVIDTTWKYGGTASYVYRNRETYRYDALGRRIWHRAIKDTACHRVEPRSTCESTITRTVWDGSQMLYEIRAAGALTATASQLEADNNRVRYTHGLGIDEPLAVGGLHPYMDWRGAFDVGTCPVVRCSSNDVWFPGATAGAFGDATPPLGGPPSWHGSLIEHGADASGLQYRRNRYYDPATGRFTQEDPIGVSGGLNLYGYANGDPITYSDPFGLCASCGQDTGKVVKDPKAPPAQAAAEPPDRRQPGEDVQTYRTGETQATIFYTAVNKPLDFITKQTSEGVMAVRAISPGSLTFRGVLVRPDGSRWGVEGTLKEASALGRSIRIGLFHANPTKPIPKDMNPQ